MTCKQARGLMDDFIDGLLEERDVDLFERHVDECLECEVELERLRKLVRDGGALSGETSPPHDLWPAIETRISQEPAATVVSWRAVSAFALSAAMIVGLILCLGLAREPLSKDHDVQAERAIDKALADYVQARDALLTELENNRPYLSPETLATVDGNLKIIEAAVTEIKLAMESEPQNERLRQMLMFAYKNELIFLDQVFESVGKV